MDEKQAAAQSNKNMADLRIGKSYKEMNIQELSKR